MISSSLRNLLAPLRANLCWIQQGESPSTEQKTCKLRASALFPSECKTPLISNLYRGDFSSGRAWNRLGNDRSTLTENFPKLSDPAQSTDSGNSQLGCGPAGAADAPRFDVAELPGSAALALTLRAAAALVEHHQAERARRRPPRRLRRQPRRRLFPLSAGLRGRLSCSPWW
jgi:hypothetical protein